MFLFERTSLPQFWSHSIIPSAFYILWQRNPLASLSVFYLSRDYIPVARPYGWRGPDTQFLSWNEASLLSLSVPCNRTWNGLCHNCGSIPAFSHFFWSFALPIPDHPCSYFAASSWNGPPERSTQNKLLLTCSARTAAKIWGNGTGHDIIPFHVFLWFLIDLFYQETSLIQGLESG